MAKPRKSQKAQQELAVVPEQSAEQVDQVEQEQEQSKAAPVDIPLLAPKPVATLDTTPATHAEVDAMRKDLADCKAELLFLRRIIAAATYFPANINEGALYEAIVTGKEPIIYRIQPYAPGSPAQLNLTTPSLLAQHIGQR